VYQGGVDSVSFSADGGQVVTGNWNEKVRFWGQPQYRGVLEPEVARLRWGELIRVYVRQGRAA
jgi:hypothetical protein